MMKQDDNWVLVYTLTDEVRSDLILHTLKNGGIDAVKMNKKDSNYMIGDIEIYVKLEDLCNAKVLIKEFE